MTIYNQDSGFKEVLKQFAQEDITFRVKSINKSRHKHIISNARNFYLIYKREYFHTFGKQFNMGNMEGESINKDSLMYCIRNNIQLIFFIHPTEIKYYNPNIFYREAKKHNWLRIQKRENYYKEGLSHEITYSIPKNYLIPFSRLILRLFKAGEIEV